MKYQAPPQYLAEVSFYEFIKQAWPSIHGNKPFVDGKHIKVICKHLELVDERKIKKLLINIPPRFAKPVGQFSYVHRKDGLRIYIKDIEVGDYILTGKGRFRKILAKYCQGEQAGYLITTFSGRKIFAEGSHPFLTTRGWREAKDLNVNDALATISTKEETGLYVSPEEARLLGYFVGDGCLVLNQCFITCADELETQDIIHCATFLGFTVRVQSYNRKNGTLVRICLSKGQNKPRDWIRSHDLSDKDSYTKRVPLAIFQANKEAIGHFIGAYIACDGCVLGGASKGDKRKDIKIEIGSVSRELLDDVQHLLNRLNIRTSLRMSRIKMLTKKQGDYYTSYKLRTCEQDDMYQLSKVVPIYGIKQSRLLSQCLSKLRFDAPYLRDPIVSIETEIEEICYCLEIEEDHTFTANDLIVHNSTIISVAFPAWVWLRNPSEEFLCASYVAQFAFRDSRKCRALIQSPWYQQNWGDKYRLLKDQNTKGRFDNTEHGYRIVTSTKGSITAEGGSIILIDDPNSAQDGTSIAEREGRLEWWTQVLSTRMNDRKNDRIIVVQQRIHEKDVSGYIIANDEDNEWTKLILPMEFESTRKSSTFIDGIKWWEDWRKTDGELLWPDRIGEKEIKSAKNQLGSYGYAGQYQQRPSPAEGGIIKKAWFRAWNKPALYKYEHIIQSWDTAITDSPDAAYSACTTWGVFYDDNDIGNVILLSQWRGRVNYPALRERAQRLHYNYLDTGEEKPKVFARQLIDMVLIEAKATGEPLIQDLRRAGIKAIAYNPKGDKTGRVQKISHYIEGGLVWLPTKPPTYDKLLPWADEFVESVASFPNAESRDIVDTMTQVLSKLRDTNFLDHPRDEKKIEQSIKPRHLY